MDAVTKTDKEVLSPSPPPEAHLEAMFSAALTKVFPQISSSDFSHQERFTIALGHGDHEVDGTRNWTAAGRADIILRYGGQPLAVVELKRQGLLLTEEDRRQGQSYANQLTPRPPLVIVTNGDECRVFDSATGTGLTLDNPDKQAVTKLFANAAQIAAQNLDWAIDVLMGPDAGVWPSAVRARTRQLIDQQSGMAWDQSKPFVTDFLIPRNGTVQAAEAFAAGRQFVLVTGPPLSGKSNILREFAEETENSHDFAVFMVRGGAGNAGLFQRLANTVSAALEWAATADDIRQWLRRLSHTKGGPTLVLAIDGIVPMSPIAAEIEEMAEAGYGPRLRILGTTDDVQGLLIGQNGRDRTALAEQALLIDLQPLKQAEFEKARAVFRGKNIGFVKGADFADEYRVPWLLRLMLADIVANSKGADYSSVFPSSLGLGLVDAIRSRFSSFAEVSYGYRLLARDFVADVSDFSTGLALEMSHGFVVRRDALQPQTRDAVRSLLSQGWIRSFRHAGGEDIHVPLAPDLFLSELAYAVCAELEKRIAADVFEAGCWLADRMDGVFLGDIIGAQAIRDLAAKQGSFSSGILSGLHEREPIKELLPQGVVAIQMADSRLRELRFNGDGTAELLNENGCPVGHAVHLDDDDREIYGQMAGWMILAQLARIRAAVGDSDRPVMAASILLQIGICSFPLLRAARDPVGHLVHDIAGHGSVLCADNGVVETTTAAMQQLFYEHWEDLDGWFEQALSKNSLPLLNRIMIALRAVRQIPSLRSEWANSKLVDLVEPAISNILRPEPTAKPSVRPTSKRKARRGKKRPQR